MLTPAVVTHGRRASTAPGGTTRWRACQARHVPRLFIAVWPPAATVDHLRDLRRDDATGTRWIPPDIWHVTLRFLGAADPAAVAERLDATPLPPAVATLGPAVTRLGQGLVVVPVWGLDDLAAAVQAATHDLGRPPDDRPFMGHLTLARLQGRNACEAIGLPVEGRFEVDGIVLVDSATTPDGADYRILRRWKSVEPGEPTISP